MEKFNKDLQNLISTQILYPHQKISLINQYIWPCLIYSLQNAPLTKIPQSFLEDLDKMIRSTVKSIIGLPHDTPNAMLYTAKKYRGLEIIRSSWETFLQHYNVCISLLKSDDKYVPYCNNLEEEMDRCIDKLGLEKQDLINEMTIRQKTKPVTIMRENLRKKEFDNWCQLPQKGKGVEVFEENTAANRMIIDKKGLTNSEWICSLKMNCNVIPVRSVLGRSSDTPQCRHCTERETLAHVLGSCHTGDLLRNNRHHEARTTIAKQLRKNGWIVHEELHCVAEEGSNRRVDIWCYNENLTKGYIIDPTVRFEVSKEQALDVDREKRTIYEPCIKYFQDNYNVQQIEVIGLLIGARGSLTNHFKDFKTKFNIPKITCENIITNVIRGSHKIINNHLYKTT